MATEEQRSLVAHLMRRAGVGATAEELDVLAERPYEDLVEELINPGHAPDEDDDLIFRYMPALANSDTSWPWSGRWIYWMVNSAHPLREKMALFWHHIFATAYFKTEHGPSLPRQVEMFRQYGLSNMGDLLLQLSRDPAMIAWLDNCENLNVRPNENYGRELLELFSMGVGNYSEDDIKAAARAFTGWTFEQPLPLYPHGGYAAHFIFREDLHDSSEKTFLGHTGNLDGGDIIDIVVQQPATGKFIGRHLYNFFVADEPGVSAWSVQEPRDPEAVGRLQSMFLESGGDLRAVMRELLNSDFFKAARFERVKSPAEWVAGAYKLAGSLTMPEPTMWSLHYQMGAMGQFLMDPPSVEGWHTGKEWIDGGTLMERINFASKLVSDPATPGVQALTNRLAEAVGDSATPDQLVDATLEYAGPMVVSDSTRSALVEAAQADGDLAFDSQEGREASAKRVAQTLRLVLASPEYQFA